MPNRQINTPKHKTQVKLKPRKAWGSYFFHHRQAIVQAGQKLLSKPIANLMTSLVIAMAFALPLLLWTMLNQFTQLTHQWDVTPKVNLFLKMNLQEPQVQELAQHLITQPEISRANYISPEQGLQSLQQKTGLRDITATLGANPLPAVIEVTPAAGLQDAEAIEQLANRLKRLPEVDTVQIDLAWVKRLIGMLDLARQVTYGLAVVLIMSALVILVNTLRLFLQSAQREIQILALLGATRPYIVRPFLYLGGLFGLGGALLAGVLVTVVLALFHTPVQRLAVLYDTQFYLQNLNSTVEFMLIGGISFLAWVTAWIVTYLQFYRPAKSWT